MALIFQNSYIFFSFFYVFGMFFEILKKMNETLRVFDIFLQQDFILHSRENQTKKMKRIQKNQQIYLV